MDKMDRPVFDNAKVKLRFDHTNRSGKRVLVLDGLAKSYENKKLFEDVNLEVFFGESVCLIGDNGTGGKSTLVKMLIHEAHVNEDVRCDYDDEADFPYPDNGTIKFGSRIKVGYLPQEVTFEDDELTLLDYFQNQHSLTISEARKELAKVLFVKEDVNKKIGALSGGEKSRLKLCSLMYNKVNLMILDEPTNHLDIDSREILEETLIGYKGGTILFVSHDRYFIAKIANRMAQIVDYKLKYYAGNYEYYRESLSKALVLKTLNQSKSSELIVETEVVQAVKESRVRQRSNKVPQKYRMEKEALESEIEDLEHEVEKINLEMEGTRVDAQRLNELYNKSKSLDETLLKCYARWEELEEIYLQYDN